MSKFDLAYDIKRVMSKEDVFTILVRLKGIVE
jgi:hypothetical protein